MTGRTEAPFVVHEPKRQAIPLVLDSPHSGERYPERFDHLPPRSVVRLAEDTHVARLWAGAPAVGATLIEASFPRAWLDANRSLADLDPALLAEPWPEPLAPSRKTVQGIGLIWRVARDGSPLYGRKLALAEVRERIEQCWRPYHTVLARTLDARHAAFGGVWHVNCHSMPSVGDPNADDPGRPRADFVLGDRDGSTCASAFTSFVATELAAMGHSVAVNDPYKGVELVRLHGRPAENRHSLQIEIRRGLYMDEVTLQPNAGYARLLADLARLCDRLAAYVRNEVRGGREVESGSGQTT